MSPPKMSLSGKEPLKSEWDVDLADVPPHEKGDLAAEFPAIIMVETEHRARNFRQHLRRQKYKRVICGVSLVIIVAVAALLTLTIVNVLRRQHRRYWKCKSSGGLPTNVNVDPQNQLIRASHDHDDQSQTSAIQLLHDYGRLMTAYKNVDENICYIDRLTETFQEGYQRWMSYEQGKKDPQSLKVISSQPIELEVVRHVADVHIYMHCQNATSYWVMEIEKTEVTSDMRIIHI